MACWVSAQTYGTGSEQDQGQTTGHEGMRGERGQSHFQWLSQQLNLTTDQQAKLQPVFQNEEQQIKAIRENSTLSEDQKHDQIRQIHDSFQPQVQSVLTPGQKQKLEQLEEQGRQRHQEKMDNSNEGAAPQQ
jgi:Spy/CpxP family protein refolding chaperone